MWSPSPSLLSLQSNEAHVWRVDLEQSPDRQESFWSLLDHEERARANRFHFEQHRRRFVVARGFLRTLLAQYLEIPPEEVRFSYGPYGKPFLSDAHRNSRLHFNASHSHELAIYAFVQDYEVGVDVEYIKENFASEDVARQFFSTYEVETLLALPETERSAAFFRCWTRKEAYIKAIGSGLSHPLSEFDVTLAPNEPAALLRVQREPESVARWSLLDLAVGNGYAGALAVDGLIHRFSLISG